MSRTFLILLLFVSLLFAGRLMAEEAVDTEIGFGVKPGYLAESSAENGKKVKPPRFKGYRAQKKTFEKLCKYLARDGQDQWLYQMATQNKVKDESCVAWYPLMKTMAGACKPKRNRKPKKTEEENEEGTEPEQVIEKQREPHLDVVLTLPDLPLPDP